MQIMYNLIREGEVDKLEMAFSRDNFDGIGHVNFNGIEEEEEILNLSDDTQVTSSMLNPILLALNYK